MVKLVTNQQGAGSHQEILISLLEKAEEVYIAVAFFKRTGYSFLEPYLRRDISFKIMAGINFGITDPQALTSLMNHGNQFNNVEAFIGKLDNKVIFHPKLYMVRDRQYCHILSCSANMTSGGLENNNESSLYVRCLPTDQVWIDSLKYFEHCISLDNADVLDKEVLKLYHAYHLKQKKINDQSQAYPDVDQKILDNDDKLAYYHRRLDQEELKRVMKDRFVRYGHAKKILDDLLVMDPKSPAFLDNFMKLTRKTPHFKERLWVSNGINRHFGDVARSPEKFQDLIRAVKDNLDRSPEVIYDAALQVTKDFKGVKTAFIGEIMMTYDYDHLANINDNPLTVLIERVGAKLPESSQKITAAHYLQFLDLVKQIVKKLNMKNMLEADYFFDQVFRLRKPKKKKK